MRSSILIFLNLIYLSTCSEPEIDNNVLVLTTDNFEKAVNDHKFLLVQFYAPWCGHCQSLKPEYAKAAAAFNDDASIGLAKVDATIEKKLAEKFNVEGYPTIKYFKGDMNNALDFNGGRSEPDIIKFINKKTAQAFKNLNSLEALTKLQDDNEVTVIGHFEENNELGQKFNAAADNLDDLVFGKIQDCEDCNFELNSIQMFKHWEKDAPSIFEGEDLESFIRENMLPPVIEFNEDSAPKVFGGHIKTHCLIFLDQTAEESAGILKEFETAAKNFKGKVLFVSVDGSKEENDRILEFFGLPKDSLPQIRGIKMPSDSINKFKQEVADLSSEGVSKFMTGVLDGSISKFLMSEDKPEKNDDSVFYLVGTEYEKVVYNPENDVFLEMYAPWCGHCQSLAPIWEKLAEHYKDNKNVIIAKSDATVNEFMDVDVQGFPTLKWYPKGDERKSVDYNGAKTLEAFIKFIDEGGVDPGSPEDDEDDEDDDELDGSEDYDDDDFEDDDLTDMSEDGDYSDYSDDEEGHQEL